MKFAGRYFSVLSLAMILALTGTIPALAVTIDFVQPFQSVTAGNPVTLDLRFFAAEYPPPALKKFNLEVSFDQSILQFTGVTFGDPVNGDQLNTDGLAIQEILSYPGAVNIIETANSAPIPILGDFLLASLSFSTHSTGTTLLGINVFEMLDFSDNTITVEYAGISSVEVMPRQDMPVPEPSTFALLGFGLAGTLFMRHRRKK